MKVQASTGANIEEVFFTSILSLALYLPLSLFLSLAPLYVCISPLYFSCLFLSLHFTPPSLPVFTPSPLSLGALPSCDIPYPLSPVRAAPPDGGLPVHRGGFRG